MNEVLQARVTVLMPGRYTKAQYVTIERFAGEDAAILFGKAIREHRHKHGYSLPIVAVDLYPNAFGAEPKPSGEDDEEMVYLGENPGDLEPSA